MKFKTFGNRGTRQPMLRTLEIKLSCVMIYNLYQRFNYLKYSIQ